MRCEECGTHVWRAGDVAPAGVYVRVDDQSYKSLVLAKDEPLPATFDGHVARYRAAGAQCACMERAAAQMPGQAAAPVGVGTGVVLVSVPAGAARLRH